MSIRFDASTDQAQRTATAFAYTHTSAFTIMTWFKIVNNRSNFSTVFSLGNSTSPYTVQTNSDGVSLLYFNGGANAAGTYTLTVGQWYHIAFVHATNGGCTVYVDGTSRITDSNANDPLGTEIDFGNDPFSEWADAEFRGARAWTIDLTSSEVNAEKGSATVVKTANLWADWDMADASTGGNDRSGNSRPLTLTGISTGASDPAIYSGGGASTFPPVPQSPFLSPLVPLIAQ